MIDALLEPKDEKYINCDVCGGEIYEGDEYWVINGECNCERCKDDFLRDCLHICEP